MNLPSPPAHVPIAIKYPGRPSEFGTAVCQTKNPYIRWAKWLKDWVARLKPNWLGHWHVKKLHSIKWGDYEKGIGNAPQKVPTKIALLTERRFICHNCGAMARLPNKRMIFIDAIWSGVGISLFSRLLNMAQLFWAISLILHKLLQLATELWADLRHSV